MQPLISAEDESIFSKNANTCVGVSKGNLTAERYARLCDREKIRRREFQRGGTKLRENKDTEMQSILAADSFRSRGICCFKNTLRTQIYFLNKLLDNTI